MITHKLVPVTDLQYGIDDILLYHLDSIVQDAENDFSFTLLFSGDGLVRVGKTVLGSQVGHYLAWRLNRKWDAKGAANFVFSGKDLIKEGTEYGKKGIKMVFIYDEARAEMNSKMAITAVSRTLEDFFAECGKYNHIVIVILPDFFELNKRYALNHGEFLINVFLQKTKVKFKYDETKEVLTRKRGQFAFFARTKKKFLYIYGQDTLNYHAVEPDFYGSFSDFWVVDREAYEEKKDAFLERDRDAGKNNASKKYFEQRNKAIYILYKELGFRQKAFSQYITKEGLPLSQKSVSNILKLSNSNKEQQSNINGDEEE